MAKLIKTFQRIFTGTSYSDKVDVVRSFFNFHGTVNNIRYVSFLYNASKNVFYLLSLFGETTCVDSSLNWLPEVKTGVESTS
jgi:hypothetical protein